MEKTNPNKIKKTSYKGRKLLLTLMALSVIGMLVSVTLLALNHAEYRGGDNVYQQMRTAALVPTSGISSSTMVQNGQEIDFAALAHINPDVVGWISSSDGVIDYPIAQAPDNDYYLTHLFTGEKNKVGSIFLDYRNQRDFSDKNTIIYGHNMLDGSMFSSLTNYAEQSYYKSYPQMTLFTPSGNYTLQLFAGIVLDGSEDSIRFTFTDNDDFSNYIRMLKENSTFTSSVSVMPEDQIVTLSTCSYTFNNARYVLFGRLASDVDS